jgi:hypothetical protein
MVMVPHTPEHHELVIKGDKAWLIVDKSDVSFEGTGCNKVGVSFESFNNQANA